MLVCSITLQAGVIEVKRFTIVLETAGNTLYNPFAQYF